MINLFSSLTTLYLHLPPTTPAPPHFRLLIQLNQCCILMLIMTPTTPLILTTR